MNHERLREIVAEIMPRAVAEHNSTGMPHAEIVHAILWPGVSAAVLSLLSAEDVPAEAGKDRRSKPWQWVARFWQATENGPELVAETDPAIMEGTGAISSIVAGLAAQLHECEETELPDALGEAAIRALLPQFRNNLGRANAAAMRIPYEFANLEDDEGGGSVDSFLCQLDVYRLDT